MVKYLVLALSLIVVGKEASAKRIDTVVGCSVFDSLSDRYFEFGFVKEDNGSYTAVFTRSTSSTEAPTKIDFVKEITGLKLVKGDVEFGQASGLMGAFVDDYFRFDLMASASQDVWGNTNWLPPGAYGKQLNFHCTPRQTVYDTVGDTRVLGQEVTMSLIDDQIRAWKKVFTSGN